MRYLLTILLLITFTANSQSKTWLNPFLTKNDALLYSVQIIGGMSEGLHETIETHYPQFKLKYPNANDSYWNPKISFKRKYMDFDNGDLRPAFFGSKGIFITFTDPYHWTNTITHLSNLTSIIIGFGELKEYPKKQRYLVVIKKAIFSLISNRIGFEIVYSHFKL